MMKYSSQIKLLMFLGILFLIFSCAKQVAITGGPKDTTPPIMIESDPPNGSVNFTENTVYVKFDEYVKLNNLNQKLIVSPPIDETPDVTIKGKGIKISLDPSLLDPNTTYSLNFNDAIVDNNEGNALHSFVYAFSTGESIDSLSFSGRVLDAFTREPITDAWVILHDVFEDSVIKSYNPGYITKVDEKGDFFIPFVRDNNYKIFALIDNNYNYMFDIPEEGIAFQDTIYRPGVENLQSTDTAGNIINRYRNYPSDIELLLFKENKQAQFISDYKRLKPNYFEIVFNSTQYEDYTINFLQTDNIQVYAKQNPDTISFWISDIEIAKRDSLTAFVSFTDPVYTDTIRYDTLYFGMPESKIGDTLVEISVAKTKEPHKELKLYLNTPVNNINEELFKLELKSDSVYIETDFKVQQDTANPLILIVKSEILEKSDYRIIVSENFVSTNSGLTNLTDTLSFNSSSSLEYGNLLLTFEDKSQEYIVQILSGDRIVMEESSIGGVCKFEFLKPAEYNIRAIKDINNNGRWDTGDYDKHLQPEPVFYYPEEYEIRANWNHELDWNPILRR